MTGLSTPSTSGCSKTSPSVDQKHVFVELTVSLDSNEPELCLYGRHALSS